ncbi:hypothetical protein E6P97_00340, partial [Patescibacteria group bacterium]
MDTQKAQIVDRLKQANNILVTVSANPTVDQLSAAIGITLLLNKLGKHATTVFSGEVPSVLEFLEPKKTIENNTDSLRDFIISLDKNKADKLRYKVEDDHVRIFITPYRTSISDKDLIFSQGDFNVEVVLALGISKQQDIDKAVSSHGRILHDATVIDIATTDVSGMGGLTLVNQKASSLCEMLVEIGIALKPDVLDMQMATAFLTGIVAQTSRFSNDKTTAVTMEMSSKLLAAGANQQLVATKLQPPKPPTPPPPPSPVLPTPVAAPSPTPTSEKGAPKPIEATKDAKLAVVPALVEVLKPEPNKVAPDGSLTIDHGPQIDLDSYELTGDDDQERLDQIHIDDQGHLKTVEAVDSKTDGKSDSESSAASESASKDKDDKNETEVSPATEDTEAKDATRREKVIEPPQTGGTLTASGSDGGGMESPMNPMAEEEKTGVLLSHDTSTNNIPAETAPADPVANPPVEPPAQTPAGTPSPSAPATLEDIERSVRSPHVGLSDDGTTSAPPVSLSVDEARATVDNLTNVAP